MHSQRDKYFFCKWKLRMKKCFKKFKNFLENKSNPFYFVCYESIIDNINHNTR